MPLSKITNGKMPLPHLVPEPAARKAMKQIEDAAGGRQQLFEALLVAPRMGPKQRHLLSLLADPLQDKKSLALLLEEAELTPAGLLQLIRDAKMSRAVVAAMEEVAARLPQVAAEAMRRAVPHEVPCDSCEGHGTHIVDVPLDPHDPELGTQEAEQTCRRCRGKGTRIAQPKTDASRTALEIGQVLQKGPAIQIGMQQNMAVPSTNPDAEPVRTSTAFRTATDRILYPSRQAPEEPSAREEPVDAEYVEKPQEG